MATKYKLVLTQDHLNEINDDPEMDGITLEAKAEDGNKVTVTLIKSDIVKPKENLEESPVEVEAEADEMIGNVAPEEQAAMQATQENIGFTNESRISSFNQFLKS
jgi:hypothetical protein